VNKRESKFKSLVGVLTDTYKRSYLNLDEVGKSFQEQAIGAQVFYLPQDKSKLWSGLVSESALKLPEKKRSKDHMYPRKISGRELLNNYDWDNIKNPVEFLKKLYYQKYGRYHLVTSEENSKLRPFQKDGVFTNPDDIYKKCGIVLVKEYKE